MGKDCKKHGSTGDYPNAEEKTVIAHAARFRALILMA